jgi:hypothetical protein
MPYDRFLIAPISTGLETDLKPWLIPDDAFEKLENAYVFRGRVRKRFGSTYMGYGWTSAVTQPLFSRLRFAITTTDINGDAAGTVPGTIFKIGQQFSIGTEIFTVPALGTPVSMLTTGSSTIHTYNTGTGAYVFDSAAPNTTVYFYPAEPVMGITDFLSGPINNQPTFAFDTQFAYIFQNGFWQQPWLGTNPIWHGTNNQFYWVANWLGSNNDTPVMFVTNFNATVGANPPATDDFIWTYNQVAANQWDNFFAYFNPNGGAPQTGEYVTTARLIIPFKFHLLLLNTIENSGGVYATSTNRAYTNRCRYSFRGSPSAVNAWYQSNAFDSSGNVSAGGGFIDATTDEQIISAEFIKDRLIVYFERSTWEIVYTGNDIQPFVWQKINTELGSESTFSTVPFDKVVLTMGTTGVHACNGTNVERIDNKIPDEIFKITQKNLGVQRVYGIRDYFVEQVYWTYPNTEKEPFETFPNKVLVYNYKTGSWAINDDCITAFGYFNQYPDETWANQTLTWAENNNPWDSGNTQAQFRNVIAGNQQGYVFIVAPWISKNAGVMTIAAMTAVGTGISLLIKDHTLQPLEYIQINNAQGVTGVNGTIYQVTQVINDETIQINPASFTGTYTGGGTVTRVSNITLLSKQWNPYVDKGRDVYVAKIDFGVTATAAGQVTVDYFPSSVAGFSMIEQGGPSGTNMLMGNNVLETYPYPTVPLESQQTRLWHPVYFQTEGECIQIQISMSDEQITNPVIAYDDFELQGMILHTMPTTSRLQ